jgi:amidase
VETDRKLTFFSHFLDTGPELYKDAPICVQLVGYRYADEALANTAALVDSIVNGAK